MFSKIIKLFSLAATLEIFSFLSKLQYLLIMQTPHKGFLALQISLPNLIRLV